MAYAIAAHNISHRTQPSWIGRGLAVVGTFFIAYAESRARLDQIDALQQKSDTELAAIGLAREDIVGRVFADICYL